MIISSFTWTELAWTKRPLVVLVLFSLSLFFLYSFTSRWVARSRCSNCPLTKKSVEKFDDLDSFLSWSTLHWAMTFLPKTHIPQNNYPLRSDKLNYTTLLFLSISSCTLLFLFHYSFTTHSLALSVWLWNLYICSIDFTWVRVKWPKLNCIFDYIGLAFMFALA